VNRTPDLPIKASVSPPRHAALHSPSPGHGLHLPSLPDLVVSPDVPVAEKAFLQYTSRTFHGIVSVVT